MTQQKLKDFSNHFAEEIWRSLSPIENEPDPVHNIAGWVAAIACAVIRDEYLSLMKECSERTTTQTELVKANAGYYDNPRAKQDAPT